MALGSGSSWEKESNIKLCGTLKEPIKMLFLRRYFQTSKFGNGNKILSARMPCNLLYLICKDRKDI